MDFKDFFLIYFPKHLPLACVLNSPVALSTLK